MEGTAEGDRWGSRKDVGFGVKQKRVWALASPLSRDGTMSVLWCQVFKRQILIKYKWSVLIRPQGSCLTWTSCAPPFFLCSLNFTQLPSSSFSGTRMSYPPIAQVIPSAVPTFYLFSSYSCSKAPPEHHFLKEAFSDFLKEVRSPWMAYPELCKTSRDRH